MSLRPTASVWSTVAHGGPATANPESPYRTRLIASAAPSATNAISSVPSPSKSPGASRHGASAGPDRLSTPSCSSNERLPAFRNVSSQSPVSRSGSEKLPCRTTARSSAVSPSKSPGTSRTSLRPQPSSVNQSDRSSSSPSFVLTATYARNSPASGALPAIWEIVFDGLA